MPKGKYTLADVAPQQPSYTTADIAPPDPPPPPPSTAPQTVGQQLVGAHPVSDIAGTGWQHLKNMVAGPYHAFTDAPRNEVEARLAPATNTLPERVLDHVGLAVNRMFVQPTVDGLKTFNTQRKAGNTSIHAPEYDNDGNYTPSAASGLMDAIPVMGPWARQFDNDAHKHGVLAALTGAGVDIAAPMGVSKALKAVAPAAAESALGIRAIDRAAGRRPGATVLADTRGIVPGSIAKQAGNNVSGATSQLDGAAKGSTIPVDLTEPRKVADSWYATAMKRNNATTAKQVGTIGKQLQERDGVPIPSVVSADEGLALKRGIGDLKTSWNPATAPDFANRAVGATYDSMHPELAHAIPGYEELNSRISNNMPIAARAGAKDLNAGWIQRSLDRMGAHTGALTVPAGMAYEGFHKAGLPGAVAGAGLGLFGTELLSSPVSRMALARAANSPISSAILPAAAVAGVQDNHPRFTPPPSKKSALFFAPR